MAIAHTLELQHDENFLHKSMRPEIASIVYTLELQHDEDFLHKNMHPDFYKGKSFLLEGDALERGLARRKALRRFDSRHADQRRVLTTGVFPTDRREPEKSVG